MNKYNLAVLNNFRDEINISYLYGKILNHYQGNGVVARYLRGSLTQSLMNFADMAEREDFMYTQPQTTVYGRSQNENILEGVACLNMRYIDYMLDFIDQNILYEDTRLQMTNTATWDVNDGLNASSRTIVQSMPRNKLCDQDTSWIDEPNMKSLMPALDQQYKAIQVREITNNSSSTAGQCGTVSNPTRTVKTVAETLESWRYPTRGSTVRDDPVGEIVRDRDAPKFRNQNEFPYGNSGLTSYHGNPGNSAPGFLDGSRPPPELARNPNESYQGTEAQRQFLRGKPPQRHVEPPLQQRKQKCCDNGDCGLCEGYQTRPQLVGDYDKLTISDGVYNKQSCASGCQRGSCSTYSARPGEIRMPSPLHGAKSGLLGEQEMNRIARQYSDGGIISPYGRQYRFNDYSLHTSDAVASQNLKISRGNSLCSYAPANIMIGDGFHYQGVDSLDSGSYPDDISPSTNTALDRLMGTKMIQSLNNQYGDVQRPEAVSSLYDMQAGRKPAEANYGGSNIFTGGTFGGGGSGKGFHFNSDGRQLLTEGMTNKKFHGVTKSDDGRGYVNLPQNNVKLWWGREAGFADDSNAAEMQRLLNRRTFRSWAPGKYGEKGITTSGDSAQEQIPYWQKAIHNRSYERDADEAVGGFETDGMIRGYGKDLNELYCRIPQKYPCGK